MSNLTGRVALVTGGSRGIGAAIARLLAAEGALVAINYRADQDGAAAVADEIGDAAIAIQADVTERGQVERLVANTETELGEIDILILNAGVWRGGRVEDVSEQDRRLVLETSLESAFHLAGQIVPGMRERGYGRIVAISSILGLIGYPGDTTYGAAKAGQMGFVRALAKEVASGGVTVNAVAPGIVDTEMMAGLPDRSVEAVIKRTPVRRAGTADEIAAAVRFLVAEGAFVTGHTLVVDGGLTA